MTSFRCVAFNIFSFVGDIVLYSHDVGPAHVSCSFSVNVGTLKTRDQQSMESLT